MNIAGLAIKRPVFIVMLVASLITIGLVGYFSLSVDLLPNVEFPNIVVTITYPGASAEEMENLITKPLEDSFSTLEGLDKVISSSTEGVSVVTAQFKLGVDVKFSEIKVRDKVALTKTILPDGINEPIIQRFTFADIPILFMSVAGKRDTVTLRELIEDKIQPRIEQLPGVASIYIWGGRKRIVKITVDKALLLANKLNMNQITAAISSRDLNSPVGIVEGPEKNITVRVKGEFEDVNQIANTPITSMSGKIVRIKDIAKVEFTAEDETTRVRVGSQPAASFAVFKQSGENSVQVAKEVINAVKDIQKDLPSDVILAVNGDTTRGIVRSIEGVQENILIGALLAILIVWLFLGNFRSAIITAVALPDSIIGAFFLIWIAGFSINTITLLSLALAVGLLIDDSIVVRENIFRHIEEGMKPMEAAEKGTNEVALAVISTTLSIMAVFIPILFLSGMIGQFFRQFGLTVAFALGVSLLDAFTMAPMLSAYWYRKSDEKKRTGFIKWVYQQSDNWNKFYDELKKVYKDIIAWALENKKKVLLAALMLFVASFSSCFFVGKGFMQQDSGYAIMNIQTYTGAPLDKTDSYIKKLEEFVAKQPDAESYFIITGGGFSQDARSNTGLLFITMKPLSQRKVTKTTDDMQQVVRKYIKDQKLDKYITAAFAVGGGMGGDSNSNTPVLITIAGDDLRVLSQIGEKIKKIVQSTPGTADVDISIKPGQPEIVLKVDPIKSEKLGLTTYDISTALRTLVQGLKIAIYKKAEKNYDIIMQMNKSDRKVTDDIKSIYLTSKTGKKIPLTAVADFEYSSGPTEIDRENKTRIVRITANLAPGYNTGMVNAKIQQALDKEVKLPTNYRYVAGGQQKQFMDVLTQMSLAMLLAFLFMYMILASLYNSFVQPFIIMLSVILAFIGGPIALLMTGYQLDLFAFIGLLMVMGLAAKNGILLLDFTNKMRQRGMQIRQALLHAAPIRLRPILMTTFAMIFGMLPIALSMGEGAKGRESLAVVVIGGLLTSTFLTLVIVPVVYEWVEGKLEKGKEKKTVKKITGRAAKKIIG